MVVPLVFPLAIVFFDVLDEPVAFVFSLGSLGLSSSVLLVFPLVFPLAIAFHVWDEPDAFVFSLGSIGLFSSVLSVVPLVFPLVFPLAIAFLTFLMNPLLFLLVFFSLHADDDASFFGGRFVPWFHEAPRERRFYFYFYFCVYFLFYFILFFGSPHFYFIAERRRRP